MEYTFCVLELVYNQLIGSNFLESAEVKGLLGLLLVDGSLNEYRTPGGGYVQLTLTGGITESAFLEEKVAEFRQFIPTKAKIVPYKTAARFTDRPDRKGIVDFGPRHTMVLRFRVSTNKLRPIYNLLYPEGERRITQQVLDLLGASSAAWTWAEGARPCDDGSVILARCGTTNEEARLVSHWLEILTGAESKIINELKKPRLLLDPRQAAKAAKALESYAPPSRLHLFQTSEPETYENRSELVSREGQSGYQGKQKAAVA